MFSSLPWSSTWSMKLDTYQPSFKIFNVSLVYLRQVDGDPKQYLQISQTCFLSFEFQETAIFFWWFWYIFGSFSGSVMFRKKDPVVSLSILKPFFRVSGEFQSGHILKKKWYQGLSPCGTFCLAHGPWGRFLHFLLVFFGENVIESPFRWMIVLWVCLELGYTLW